MLAALTPASMCLVAKLTTQATSDMTVTATSTKTERVPAESTFSAVSGCAGRC